MVNRTKKITKRGVAKKGWFNLPTANALVQAAKERSKADATDMPDTVLPLDKYNVEDYKPRYYVSSVHEDLLKDLGLKKFKENDDYKIGQLVVVGDIPAGVDRKAVRHVNDNIKEDELKEFIEYYSYPYPAMALAESQDIKFTNLSEFEEFKYADFSRDDVLAIDTNKEDPAEPDEFRIEMMDDKYYLQIKHNKRVFLTTKDDIISFLEHQNVSRRYDWFLTYEHINFFKKKEE